MYEWNGGLDASLGAWYTATFFCIEDLEGFESGWRVRGLLHFKDDFRVSFHAVRWEAIETKNSDGSTIWTIEPVVDPSMPHPQDPATGHPVFTAESSIHEGIKGFIKNRLDGALVSHQDTGSPKSKRIVAKAAGPCVCFVLVHGGSFSLDRLIPAASIYREKLVSNCFTCSCKENWWAPIQGGRWYPVPDRRAWEMFVENEGKMNRPIRVFPDGVHLL